MSDKRFTLEDRGYDGFDIYDSTGEYKESELFIGMSLQQIVDCLNKLNDENEQLKEEGDALQKKIEMDKNDFFISEAKRMRLLAFIEDNGLRKEYYEWERRIWDE